jgi:hypothetical protein
MIPLGETPSFREVAENTSLGKAAVGRLLLHAMAMGIRRGSELEIVAHTSISRVLTIPYINACS